MNISALRSLVAVMEQGSFAGAARALGLSQSAITAHIHVVEAALGVALFDRSTRPPRPTEAASDAAARARNVLAAFDDMRAPKGIGKAAGARLRLGAVSSLLPGLLPQVLTGLREAQPGLHVELVSGFSDTLIQAVHTRRLDAAFVSDYESDDPAIAWRPLVREPLVVIAPALAGDSDVQRLAREYAFIRYSPSAALGRVIDKAIRREGLMVRETMRLDRVDGIEAMVRHGHGFSIVPDPLVPGPGRSGLRTFRFGARSFFRHIGLVEPFDRPERKVTDAVSAEVRRLVAAQLAASSARPRRGKQDDEQRD